MVKEKEARGGVFLVLVFSEVTVNIGRPEILNATVIRVTIHYIVY